MSQRIANFRSFKNHLIIGQCFKALSQNEIDLCEQFIMENDHLDKNEFALKVNRWMVDNPKNRPSQKKASAMWALVCQANGALPKEK